MVQKWTTGPQRDNEHDFSCEYEILYTPLCYIFSDWKFDDCEVAFGTSARNYSGLHIFRTIFDDFRPEGSVLNFFKMCYLKSACKTEPTNICFILLHWLSFFSSQLNLSYPSGMGENKFIKTSFHCWKNSSRLAVGHFEIKTVVKFNFNVVFLKFIFSSIPERYQRKILRKKWKLMRHVLVDSAFCVEFKHQIFKRPKLDSSPQNFSNAASKKTRSAVISCACTESDFTVIEFSIEENVAQKSIQNFVFARKIMLVKEKELSLHRSTNSLFFKKSRNWGGISYLLVGKKLSVIEVFIDSDRGNDSASNRPTFNDFKQKLNELSDQKCFFSGFHRVL